MRIIFFKIVIFCILIIMNNSVLFADNDNSKKTSIAKRRIRSVETHNKIIEQSKNIKSDIKNDSIILSIASVNKIVLQWTHSIEEVKSQVLKYGLSPWEVKEILNLTKNDSQAIITNLKPNTRYYYQIEIESENQRIKKSLFPTPPGFIKTNSVAPKSSNKFNNINISQIVNDSPVLEFATDEYSVFEIRYGTDKRNLTEKTAIDFYSKNAKVILVKPPRTKNYYYSIKATDIFNNVIESGIKEF